MHTAVIHRLPALALAGAIIAAWNLPGVVNADMQVAQSAPEREAQRAAESAEFDAQRARDDEKQERHDADVRTRRDLLLEREETERDSRAGEAIQRRAQRNQRLKLLIDR